MEAELKSTESYLADLGEEVEALQKSNKLNSGCVHLGLEFRPVKEEVVVQVFSARNLVGKCGDPFVEVGKRCEGGVSIILRNNIKSS